jgi:Tfp pilus assembly PilM family ATPase
MSVEPSAVVDCFGHIYKRKEDKTAISCYVDVGCASSRAIIAQGAQILFARSIKIGGEHLNRAVASNLGMAMEDAKMLRLKLCYQQPGVEDPHRKQDVEAGEPQEADRVNRNAKFRAADGASSDDGDVMTATATSSSKQKKGLPADPGAQQRLVEEACTEPLKQLAGELDLCRRYYEATFSNKPVDRLIFVGGEAKHRSVCQFIAGEMGLPAQVGDPLVRMGRTTTIGIESGIDRRQAQPGWAVAIGLSLGPTANSSVAAETK